jgi:AcrR family transcriptional regulator
MANPKPSSLSQRKYASQERAGATVEAIVEAAARILATDGAKGLTTNRVAKVAGVSIGSVYQYFPNKEAIVVALVDAQLGKDKQLFLNTMAAGGASVERPTLSAAMQNIIAQLCTNHHRVAPLLAALLPLLPDLRQEQLVHQRIDEMCALFEHFLADYVLELRPALREPEQRKRTVRLLADAVRGALNAAVTQPERLATAQFQADVCALAMGALTNDERPGGKPQLS